MTNNVFTQPRESYKFMQDVVFNQNNLELFQSNPIAFLESRGVNTSEFQLPDNFRIPTKEEINLALAYYYSNEEFVSPAMHAEAAAFWVVFLFIPAFAY